MAHKPSFLRHPHQVISTIPSTKFLSLVRPPKFTLRILDAVSTEASVLSHCGINHWVMEGQISNYLPTEEISEGLNEIMKTMQTMTTEFNDEIEMW